MELYKKYRPTKLDEVVGNKHVIDTISKYLAEGKLANNILLTGPSGCGKTTLAMIIGSCLGADEANFLEFDSADTSGVGFIRQLRDTLPYPPTGKAKAKVYFIDECHALSSEASDALLKALEKNKSFNYFIFATTAPQKLTPTLKQRCTPYALKALSPETIAKELLYPTCKKEGRDIDKDILIAIANNCDGSPRKAMTLLHGVIFSDAPKDEIIQTIKAMASETNAECIELFRAIVNGSSFKVLCALADKIQTEPESIRRAALPYFTSVLKNKGDDETFKILVAFEKNYYDTGKAGLFMSLYECCQ